MRIATLSLFIVLLGTAPSWAQSGRIAGQVTDAETGEALPGASVLVVESSQGAASDLDGYYSILNVSPGDQELRVSFVGYETQVVENVSVNIGLTSTVDVALAPEAVAAEEVVVRAERPVVLTDVSNSMANVSQEDIEALPVSSVTGVIGLQAGIQGLTIRSDPNQNNGADELSFNVNGLTLRNERTNTPYSNISLSSVREIQIQTGGFNAEYGTARSGVIEVVTKEGSRDRYEATGTFRLSAPRPKQFGPMPNSPNAYWIRPFVDDAVAWTGTDNGNWDRATQEQYPSFQGWNAVSEGLLTDDDPTNDLTPQALQEAFLWQHRKSFEITQPDYNVDLGFGGPVPGISRHLGDLRFYASYRRDQTMYMVPLHTNRYTQETGHVKLTSNIADGMKVSVEGRVGVEEGTSASRSGGTGFFVSPSGISGQMTLLGTGVGFVDSRLFSTDYWTPARVLTYQTGLSFTHALNSDTFYEVRLNRFGARYRNNPGPRRDTSCFQEIGGVCFDEGPFGFQPEPSSGVDGMRMGVGMSNARDSSRVANWNLKGDLTHQVNQWLQVKTGLEYNITESNMNYGSFDAFLPEGNFRAVWNRTPVRGALYGQTKIELDGMIANLGLRADYSHAGGSWYEFELFDPAFGAAPADPIANLDTLLETRSTNRILTLSPRLGVSFPVTSVSKLFVNYGHFRSLPSPDNLYLIQYAGANGRIEEVSDPNLPFPKTVAYEIGYEQSFLEQLLVRATGYYKDNSNLLRDVEVISRDGSVEYDLSTTNGFEDVRGFELTLERDRGNWIRGFLNYTYMVYTSGYFDSRRQYENPTEQRNFDDSDTERRRASSRPVARPYARLNLDVFLPPDLGPSVGGLYPLGDWRINFLGRWQDGGKYTWVGGGSIPGVANNVDRKDFWNLELRFARTFRIADRDVTFFADVYNALNIRRMSFNGFFDGNDRDAYLRSLHLPESEFYDNIVGTDRVGDFRDSNVNYVPIRPMGDFNQFGPEQRALYYDSETQEYFQARNGELAPASSSQVQEVLDTKAYIDMPNQTHQTFLGRRQVFLGIRVNI